MNKIREETRITPPKKEWMKKSFNNFYFSFPSTVSVVRARHLSSEKELFFSYFYHRHRRDSSHAVWWGREATWERMKERNHRSKRGEGEFCVRIVKVVSLWTVQCSTIIKIYYHSVSFRFALLCCTMSWRRPLCVCASWVKVLYAHASVDT